jgi:hypothetical protein
MRALTLALILGGLLAATGAQAGTTPLISNCGKFVAKPKQMTLFCADLGGFLEKLRWRSWGSARASATGIASVNDCSPYCAAGHFHSYPITVTGGRLMKCGATWHYNLLTVTFTGARPKGLLKVNRFPLTCRD